MGQFDVATLLPVLNMFSANVVKSSGIGQNAKNAMDHSDLLKLCLLALVLYAQVKNVKMAILIFFVVAYIMD